MKLWGRRVRRPVPWIVALLVVAIASCGGSTSSSSTAAHKAVALRAIRKPNAELFMSVSATPAQTAAVRRLLQRSPQVRRFAFLSRDDAWREFRKLFATQPDVIAGTTADRLPTSFRIELADGAKAAAIRRTFRGVAGVDDVKFEAVSTKADRAALAELGSACLWRNSHPAASDMEVFLRLDATPAETEAVRSAIAGSELVRTFAFVPRSEAFRLFRQMFAHRPKVLRSTTAAGLPESFRIGLKDPTTRDQLQRELANLAGVDSVQTGKGATAAECQALARTSS